MSKANNLDDAFQRLTTAIGQLEAAVDRRLKSERTVAALQDELQRSNEDRARLADTLDGAEARSDRLEQANKEVSRRLVSAMESIRTVLESHGG